MKLRNRILACALACMTALAGLASAVASAQTEDAPAFAKGKETRATFVVYRNAAGEVTCRVATAAERRRIIEARPADGLHLIYGGAPTTRRPGGLSEDTSVPDGYSTKSTATNAATSAGTLPALLPSAGLHIFLHGTTQLEQNPDAKNAFIVAANRWEALVSNPVNVVIDVDYGTQFFGQDYPSADILGQTGSRQVSTTFGNLRQRLVNNAPTSAELQLYNALPASTVPVETGGANTTVSSVLMTKANARALGLVANITNPASIPSGGGDASIGFNSAFGFDFNPADGISAGKTDFDAVVTHEIGHALGFVSNSGDDNTDVMSVWDVFRFRPGAASLSTMATAPRVMVKGGTQVFFDAQSHTVTDQTGQSTTTQELGLS
ncbi:MAG TPA: NF038122 family metalloprotease, partial [Pyrinomonadaceae bacterium]|nr:NF038122 family metalloprotease [Pyrinomonadaceae bacterium]